MSKQERLLLYPCAKSVLPVIRYLLAQQHTVSLESAVAPRGWIKGGLDAGYLDNRGEMGILVSNDFMEELSKCDTVFIPETTERIAKADVLSKIEAALRNGKKVLCNYPLSDTEVASLQSQSDRVEFQYLPALEDTESPSGKDLQTAALSDFQVPIIVLGELVGQLNATEVLLGLKIRLQRDGYRVSAFSNDPNCVICDHKRLPEFLTGPGRTESDKVLMLNAYLQKEIEMNHPDVILFQMPAPMLPFNKKIPNGFGILPYICSQAFEADFFILCAPFETETGFFTDMNALWNYRFGFPIHAVAMSNATVDIDSDEQYKIVLNYLNDRQVYQQIQERRESLDIKLFYALRELELDKLYQYVIEYLSREMD